MKSTLWRDILWPGLDGQGWREGWLVPLCWEQALPPQPQYALSPGQAAGGATAGSFAGLWQELQGANKVCLGQRLAESGETGPESDILPSFRVTLGRIGGEKIQFYYCCYCVIIIVVITEKTDQNFCPQRGAPQIANRATWQPKQERPPVVSARAACCCYSPSPDRSIDRPLREWMKEPGREIPREMSYCWKIPCHVGINGIWPFRLVIDSLGISKSEEDRGDIPHKGPSDHRIASFDEDTHELKIVPSPECGGKQASRFLGACVTEMQWGILMRSLYQKSRPSV